MAIFHALPDSPWAEPGAGQRWQAVARIGASAFRAWRKVCGSRPGSPLRGVLTLIVAGILMAILILQNLQEVEVKFLMVNTTIPLIFALLIVGALGALVGWATPRVRRGGPDRD